MTRNNRNCKLPRAIFFLDGFKIRHGVALCGPDVCTWYAPKTGF